MILDLFFGFVRGFFSLIITPITSVTLPWSGSVFFSDTLGYWGGSAGVISWFFPFGTLVACIGVLVAWTVACHLYRIALWLLGVLHISGDSG